MLHYEKLRWIIGIKEFFNDRAHRSARERFFCQSGSARGLVGGTPARKDVLALFEYTVAKIPLERSFPRRCRKTENLTGSLERPRSIVTFATLRTPFSFSVNPSL